MAIIETISDKWHFADWIKKSDSYKNNFSLDGAMALQEYLDTLSDELEEDIEFDPIAWCCEYSEYDNIADYNKQHGTKWADWDELHNETPVILIDGTDGAIVQDY